VSLDIAVVSSTKAWLGFSQQQLLIFNCGFAKGLCLLFCKEGGEEGVNSVVLKSPKETIKWQILDGGKHSSITITFVLLLRCQQTKNMEKTEKLKPAQSFPFLCHSPRSSPECREVPLRKSVSVSELVARWAVQRETSKCWRDELMRRQEGYQSILDCESNMSKKERPKLMERRYLSQTNVSPLGKSCTLSQSHLSDVCLTKSMEDLPIRNISVPTKNLRGLQTSFDTPKATPRCKSLHFAPLKTPSPNGILRKKEADARILATIQPLSMESKPHRDPPFPSSLQSIQRKEQWSPGTIKWKESPAKVSRCSSLKAPGILFSLGVQSHS
ncbi:hypothetical protein Q9233_016124, partial [Columba guinea]